MSGSLAARGGALRSPPAASATDGSKAVAALPIEHVSGQGGVEIEVALARPDADGATPAPSDAVAVSTGASEVAPVVSVDGSPLHGAVDEDLLDDDGIPESSLALPVVRPGRWMGGAVLLGVVSLAVGVWWSFAGRGEPAAVTAASGGLPASGSPGPAAIRSASERPGVSGGAAGAAPSTAASRLQAADSPGVAVGADAGSAVSTASVIPSSETGSASIVGPVGVSEAGATATSAETPRSGTAARRGAAPRTGASPPSEGRASAPRQASSSRPTVIADPGF
jgi:hypothetical protein